MTPEEAFTSFFKHAYANVPINSIQYRECRQCFYAGAMFCLAETTRISENEEELAFKMMNDFQSQLRSILTEGKRN